MVDSINCPPLDRFQVITEHTKENWSFGNGIAQYAASLRVETDPVREYPSGWHATRPRAREGSG
jgi:hypothetical protein